MSSHLVVAITTRSRSCRKRPSFPVAGWDGDMASSKITPNKCDYCFICGKIESENEVSCYGVPPGKLAEWQKLILKSVLTQRSRLCEKHFDKAINKGNQTATEFVPAVKPRLLSRNVVPTQHLGGNNTSLYYNYCNQW